MNIKRLAFFLLTILMLCPCCTGFAARKPIPMPERDFELYRADQLGLIPEEWKADWVKRVTLGEYCGIVRRMIEIWMPEKLPEWDQLAAGASNRGTAIKRQEAILVLAEAEVLLGRQDSPKKSAVRVVRIMGVIFLFAIPYYLYQHSLGLRGLHPVEFAGLLITKHLTVAHWYLYAYLGLLCILPLMQKMSIHFEKSDIRLMLVLSLGINGVRPLCSAFLGANVSSHIGGSFFGSNIAMVFAGYYLEKYCTMNKRKVLGACAVFAGLVALQVAATLKLYAKNQNSYLLLDEYSSILIVTEAACVFCIVKHLFAGGRICESVCRWIQRIGGLTFGIYLLSDMVIELSQSFFYWMTGYVHPIPAVIMWEVLVFAVGGMITFGLKRLPVLRRLL